MRPDPILKIDTAFFWEACEREEFVAQKFICSPECKDRERLWHPPRPMCPKCHSTEKEVQQLSGLGTVVSWCVAVRPQAFGFEESPIAALIELDEGLRFISNIEGVAEEDMQIGIRVQVAFADTSGGKKLSFNGIITGTSFSSTVGDISTVSVSFQTTGDITSAA